MCLHITLSSLTKIIKNANIYSLKSTLTKIKKSGESRKEVLCF